MLRVDLSYLVDRLVEMGVDPKVAARKVWEASDRVLAAAQRSGIGAFEPVEAIRKAAEAEPVKRVRETVSPWLWVLSIIGFGLGLLNTRRIARMFKDWKAGKKR